MSIGCGKGTRLNLVADLNRPNKGSVLLHGIEVSGPNSGVGFMLQNDLLLSWRTVLHNVEFGLEARNLIAAERIERVMRELKRCWPLEFADRYPYQMIFWKIMAPFSMLNLHSGPHIGATSAANS